MKLTKRQLRNLIAESLGVKVLQEVNFKRIRKDLFKLKDDIDNQVLLNKVSKHAEDLKTKVDAGETGILKGRYREAVTLLRSLESVLNAPTPSKVNKVIQDVQKAEEVKPEQSQPDSEPEEIDGNDWNPDPDGKGIWEYQLRNCTWYGRRVAEPEKEFKLGKSKQTWGKYKSAVKILDNAFPELIKDCDVPKKPKPKPKPEPKPETDPDPDPDTNVVPDPGGGSEEGPIVNVDVAVVKPLKELAKLFRKLRKIRKEGGGFMSATSDFANDPLPYGIPADIDGGYADMIIACLNEIEKTPSGIDKTYDYMNKNLGNNFTLEAGLIKLLDRWKVASRVFKENGYRQGEFAELCNDIDREMRTIKKQLRWLSWAMDSSNKTGKIWIKENEERLSRGSLYRRKYYGRY